MEPERHKFQVLDSWRGICACFIALFHFHTIANSHLFFSGFFQNAYLFVDFFFVLSGFVIFMNYEEKLRQGFGFRRFMLLRFGRLYPLHVVLLMLIVIFALAQAHVPVLARVLPKNPFSGPDEFSYLPSQLFLLHGLGFSDRLSFNHASWAVSAEFYSYAVFALLIILLKDRVMYGLGLIVLVSGVYLSYRHVYLIGTYDFGFIRCLYSFAIGGLLWRVFSAKKEFLGHLSRSRFWPWAEFLLPAVAIMLIDWRAGAPAMAYPFIFATMIAVFALEAGPVSKFLKKKPFIFLGTLSYSVYMLQSFAVFGFTWLFGVFLRHWPDHYAMLDGKMLWGVSKWEGDAMAVLYLLAIVAASVFTYYLVEMPGRDYFRKLAQGRK